MQTGAITDFSYSWIKQWREGFFSNLEVGYSGYQNQYTEQTKVTTRKGKNTTTTLFDTYEENKLNDFSTSLKNEFALGLKNTVDFWVSDEIQRIYLPERRRNRRLLLRHRQFVVALFNIFTVEHANGKKPDS